MPKASQNGWIAPKEKQTLPIGAVRLAKMAAPAPSLPAMGASSTGPVKSMDFTRFRCLLNVCVQFDFPPVWATAPFDGTVKRTRLTSAKATVNKLSALRRDFMEMACFIAWVLQPNCE